jgi:hypothetical protein
MWLIYARLKVFTGMKIHPEEGSSKILRDLGTHSVTTQKPWLEELSYFFYHLVASFSSCKFDNDDDDAD